ncbi:MAG: hypothetical protein K6E64_02250 [Lachnospiraceae bacterium]|nr:hypothetical protein [Lachnospiraceae bacterium]
MIEQKLHEIATTQNLTFENILAAYVKESILQCLYENGFGSCLCMKHPETVSFTGYAGRAHRGLHFIYVEDERILESDGFVPGCPYKKDYLEQLFSKVLKNMESLEIQNPVIKEKEMFFDVYCENMYVPFLISLDFGVQKNATLNQRSLTLPILEKEYKVLTYPLEQEAADHLGVILKELELINEMEHYLALYDMFSKEAIEGVRFQNALTEVLHSMGMEFCQYLWETVSSYKTYSYMKKKWKVLLRRQKRTNPTWEEVISLLSAVIDPIWECSKNDMVFFGDWMPEIGRYLD